MISIILLIAVPFSLQILLHCPTGRSADVDVSNSKLLNSSQLEPPSFIGECNCKLSVYYVILRANFHYQHYSRFCYQFCWLPRQRYTDGFGEKLISSFDSEIYDGCLSFLILSVYTLMIARHARTLA